jgi:hypothetical protein
MLSELKNFDAKRMDLVELVALASFGRDLQAEFGVLGVESPEWIEQNLKAVHREIKSRNADRIAARIREAKTRLETLKTPSEKRTDLQAELARLEKQLKSA